MRGELIPKRYRNNLDSNLPGFGPKCWLSTRLERLRIKERRKRYRDLKKGKPIPEKYEREYEEFRSNWKTDTYIAPRFQERTYEPEETFYLDAILSLPPDVVSIKY